MRLAVSGLVAALAAACSPQTEMAMNSAETPEMAAAALPGIAAPPSAPCAGATLPVTGLCTDAGDALYAGIYAHHEVSAPHCIWRPQEAALGANEALVFRAQDCSQGRGDVIAYRFADGRLTVTYPPHEGGAEPYQATAMEIFPLNGDSAEAVALETLRTAPQDQRAHCVIRPLPSAPTAGHAFMLAPDDALRARLEAAAEEEMYDACGLYGTTDSATYWEARNGRALFHSTGQDAPAWDPASFTFYRRGADGAWARAD